MYGAVAFAGCASLAVLAVVGRQSYKRKVVQLSKQLEFASCDTKHAPAKVWAVLTPVETVKVFFVPLFFVFTGTGLAAYGLKRLYGFRDIQQGIDTLRWVTRTGPPPS